ncbi:hypothetical protein [Imhoffiella purpurea]|nr:hypothetical protein [Imhoffiella purpurea]
MTRVTFAIPAAAILALTLTACGDEDDGKAEQMGAKIDQTVEQAKGKVEEMRDSMSDAMEKAGDKIEETADGIENKTD